MDDRRGFTLLPVPDGDFDALTIAHARPIVAVQANDPIATRERVSWRDLDGREAISFEHCFPAHQQRMEAMLAEHGVTLATVQYADDIEGALALVSSGLGIALLHLYISRPPFDDIVFVGLPDDAPKTDNSKKHRKCKIS